MALAEALGFKPAAFSNRKRRGALPMEEIDELIAQKQINRQWVFSGDGPMYEGGDTQQRCEQDYRELIAQMEAMSLHNETKRLVKPLLKGVVWGDATSVEQWIQELGNITADERLVLHAYRAGGPEVKAAIDLIARQGVAHNKPGRMTQIIHGKIGQFVDGDMTIQGNLSLNMSGPKKDKQPKS